MDGLPKQLTMTNKLITQVYRRRRYKSKGKEVDETTARQVFDAPIPEYEKVLDDLNSPIASVKRKVTPVSTDSLRRSERKSAVHKVSSPHPRPPKSKPARKILLLLRNPSHSSPHLIFMTLWQLMPCLRPVTNTRKFMCNSYGIPPVEATVGLLLATDAGEN
jgi:hypothetical protein